MFNTDVSESLKKRGVILRVIGFISLAISFIATIFLTCTSTGTAAFWIFVSGSIVSILSWFIFDALALLCYGVGVNIAKTDLTILSTKTVTSKVENTKVENTDSLKAYDIMDLPEL